MQSKATRWLLAAVVLTTAAAAIYWLMSRGNPGPADIGAVRLETTPPLLTRLEQKGLALGSPVFIRIFKQPKELEVWIAKASGDKPARYALFQTYPICAYSGELGPKLKEGDRQSPEGFYSVDSSALNPNSSYHLSFNLGFPNAYDRSHGRTGSFLMVHGRCVSVGCYAMTDRGIDEIYLLVEAALLNGGPAIPVHIFPFRMTAANMEAHKASPWHAFWTELKTAHDAFEATSVPPRIEVKSARYIVAP